MIYRSDNRSPDQMRPVNIVPDFISTAEGSCLIELGNTRVICTATIEDTVPPFLAQQRQRLGHQRIRHAAALHADAHPARGHQGPRRRAHPRNPAAHWPLAARRHRPAEAGRAHRLFLDCDVIQADGGTRTASITGAFVAMGLAMLRMVESGALTVAPIRDYVAATSVGIVDGEIMLDLCYEEDSRADVDMNVVITGSKKLVEVQATAERRPFDDAQLAKMMAVARKGIEGLIARQQALLTGLPLRQ